MNSMYSVTWHPKQAFMDSGRLAATLCWKDLSLQAGPPSFKVMVLAFDDTIQEHAGFKSQWVFGPAAHVDLAWRPDVVAPWAVTWAGMIVTDTQTLLSDSITYPYELSAPWVTTRLNFFPGSLISKGEEFRFYVWRLPTSPEDTLLGDALLLEVTAREAYPGHSVHEQRIAAPDPAAISDEEYARRAGFYRGPK